MKFIQLEDNLIKNLKHPATTLTLAFFGTFNKKTLKLGNSEKI